MKAEKQLSRFVIPFFFLPKEYEAIEKAREADKQPGEEAPQWQKRKLHRKETAFFPFFRDSLQPEGAQTVGSLWRADRKGERKKARRAKKNWQEFFFRLSLDDPKPYMYCAVTDVGMALFKTGVGLAWFDLTMKYCPDIRDPENLCPPEVEQMVVTNNYCKDICHRRPIPRRSRLLSCPPSGEEGSGAEFWLFDWVHRFFFLALEGVEFFAPVPWREGEGDGAVCVGPDKAHIFTSAYVDRREPEEEARLLYWLRKGYRVSYQPAERDLDPCGPEVLRSFDNMTWGISAEGCALLAYRTGRADTDKVFAEQLEDIREKSFLLYLSSLQQYYTLLRLFGRMAELPGGLDGFDREQFYRLRTVQEELGLAYTRSFFPRVSYVDHQNKIYDRFREVLQIDRLQEDLSRKADILSELVQAYETRKRERLQQTLTVTGGIFVVWQTVDTFLGLYDIGSGGAGLGRWVFSLLALGLSVLLGAVITRIWHGRGGKGV